jgi:hypothetical protein
MTSTKPSTRPSKKLALMANLTPILLTLSARTEQINGPIKAGKASINAEIAHNRAQIEAAEERRAAAKERNDKAFGTLRAETASLKKSLSEASEGRTAEQIVTAKSFAAQLEAVNKKWDDLVASSRQEMFDISRNIRHHHSAIRALNGLMEGIAFGEQYEEGPSSAAVEIVRKAVFEANGRVLRTLTSASHGGCGMPRREDGTFGGLAAFVSNGSIVKLETAERAELMNVVGTLKAIGCVFKGEDRAPIWAVLEAAYSSDRATAQVEAAANTVAS